MTRIYELDDKTWLTAEDGTASWRNNNPGNLKLEFAGSEQGSHAIRTKDEALETVRHMHKGIVDRQEWIQKAYRILGGNFVSERTAADLLGKSEGHLRIRLSSRSIPCRRVMGSPKYTVEDLALALENIDNI
jgi:hypothetical protein